MFYLPTLLLLKVRFSQSKRYKIERLSLSAILARVAFLKHTIIINPLQFQCDLRHVLIRNLRPRKTLKKGLLKELGTNQAEISSNLRNTKEL